MSPTDVFSSGSTALITGAGAGIGLAIAKICRSKGMRVLLVDNDDEALENLSKQHFPDDSDVITSKVDVSSTSDWQDLKKLAQDKFGTIELLVLNAGRGMKGTWGDESYFRDVSATEHVYPAKTNEVRPWRPTFSVSSTASTPFYLLSKKLPSPSQQASSSLEASRVSPTLPVTQHTTPQRQRSRLWLST
jgi:NAD(P)-dependent dehydrogenase (short-subunit alcohol dehydrogenase family)